MALGSDNNVIHTATTCPRCGHSNDDTFELANCRQCGTDATVYNKTVWMSNVYYNKGLAAANARALTDAINALNTSLAINKRNVQARNLLGLCYYAVGRLGEALREWVISTNYDGESESNPAKGYLEVFDVESANLDKYSEGLRNYNEALRYLTHRNDDMALIRLKRAVELIPSFVDAINLQTLVHIRDGDKMKAGGLVERALRIDATNPTAHRYYSEIFRKKAPAAKRADETAKAGANPPRNTLRQPTSERTAQHTSFGINQKPFKRRSPLVGLLWLILGAGAALAAMYLIVMPMQMDNLRDENAELTSQIAAYNQTHETAVAELEATIAEHEASLAEAASLAAVQANRLTDLQHEGWVNIAHGYLLENSFAQALAVLGDVDAARLSPESFEVYTAVRNAAMPVMEQHYFDIGQGFFNGGNYEQARENLERAVMHATDASTVADWSFYLLGRIAEAEGEFELARQFYEAILEQFPTSNRVNAANLRLNAISQ